MSERTVLDLAAALIRTGGHAQGADARTIDGGFARPTDRDAVSFSITGAVILAGYDYSGRVFVRVMSALGRAVGAGRGDADGWSWEDVPGHCRAIAAAMWEWEDEPGRDVGDVLAMIARARKEVHDG